MKNKSIKVIYIAGNGHSGSTLLDIIIGSSPGLFSAGELGFITRDSIFDEYCSCGEMICKCPVWTSVVEKWLSQTDVTLKEYKQMRWEFERSKTTLKALKNSVFPSQRFLRYCRSTLALYESIRDVTGKSIIVDSTKSPQRIAVLNKIVDLKVIHICREAKGVLNSGKRSSKKDIKAGIEADLPARRTGKALTEWVFVNLMTEIFCIGVPSKKLKYKKYIKNLNYLEELDDAIKITANSFSAPHMLAGNVLRLKKNIIINPDLGFTYTRLTKKQSRAAKLVDALFPFWS